MRSIIHLDADAFFAAVEQAADPRLRGKPVAVGGEKRGIIASASYEARRFGIYTPMPTVRARKLCPKLVLVPGDFEKYERFSRWMFSYAYDFTPDVEVTSIDEGYLDLSGVRKSSLEVAVTLQQAIRQALKVTVSEGLGTNKLVSQIASKLNKPAAFLRVPPGQEVPFLHPLPNRWLPGIGPQMGVRLDTAGLARIRHVAATATELLSLLVGRAAPQLKQFANGIDDRPVVPVSAPAKSYGQQETFAEDQTDEEFLEATLRRMADALMAKVRADSKSIRTLTVKVRYNDMAEDQCGESLAEPTDLETDLYSRLSVLLRQAWKRRVSLRLVSLKFSNIYEGCFREELPLTVGARQHENRRRLAGIVDELRRTRGPKVVMRGHDLSLAEFQDRSADHECDKTRPQGGATLLRSSGFPGRAKLPPSPTIPPGTSTGVASVEEGKSGRSGSFLLPRSGVLLKRLALSKSAIPLAVRSYYSFLDSTLSIPAIVALAQRYELPAIALADQANLHGAVEFFQAASQAGIRPILGVELQRAGQPLWLYVQNTVGYRNLCRWLNHLGGRGPCGALKSTAGKSGLGGSLALPKNGVLPKNGALPKNGVLPGALEEGLTDGLLAVSADPQLADLFPDRFYLAVEAAADLDRLAAPCHLPRVAMWPARYATASDRWKYDVVQSIRTLTLLRRAHPQKQLGGEFHFRAPAELERLFRAEPELIEHTHEIAERCAFAFSFGKPQFPAFAPPDGSAPHVFLRQLVFEGLRRRYPTCHAQLRAQVETELAIIQEVGYEEYFLVVWDILQDCRREGIEWITRGSAADSLVCYCLGISDVCPIRFDLYFRRFLNRERMALNKLPDIDVDFPHDRKDDVVDLIFAKYGAEHTAVVGGFSTFQARSAFAEVAKVLGVAEREVRKFTDHFPWSFGGGWVPDEPTPSGGAGLVEMLRASPENRDLPFDEEPYRTALHLAEFLDAFPRYPKMHPCGLVLSREPMSHLTPCFTSQKGYPTTHFDMDAVEAIGLVKMDILAQGGLAVMRDARAALHRRGIEVDLNTCTTVPLPMPAPPAVPLPISDFKSQISDFRFQISAPALSSCQGGVEEAAAPHFQSQISDFKSQIPVEPWTDPEVWEMIAGGNARAVHHIESPAMISLCRQCNVREIDGLIAIVSVIRPGAANEGKKLAFTRRYQGLEPVAYPHPSLAACLRSTYGLVVYEEHILQICEAFAGLPPGRADVLRRALNKQKRAVIEEIRGEFFQSAAARGHSPGKTAEVWDLVNGFAGYAFCKAHSTAYGVEAYQAAWLKRYFPAEFMAGVLTNGKGFYQPLVYVLEAHRLGLGFLPPSLNEPGPAFAVTVTAPKKIRVPVTYLKGLTDRTKERLIVEHQRGRFTSLADFYVRVQPTPEETELLLRAGAFDEFGSSRPAQFWEIQFLVRRWGKSGTTGQGWLLPPAEAAQLPQTPLVEPTRLQRLQWEMELLGFPASGHPLELYPDIAWDTYCPVNRLGEFVGQQVTLCGLIIEDRVHHQITGEPMKFLTMADWTGMVETELFAQTYKSYGLATVRYPVLEITAQVEPFDNGRGHSLRVLRAGRPRKVAASVSGNGAHTGSRALTLPPCN